MRRARRRAARTPSAPPGRPGSISTLRRECTASVGVRGSGRMPSVTASSVWHSARTEASPTKPSRSRKPARRNCSSSAGRSRGGSAKSAIAWGWRRRSAASSRSRSAASSADRARVAVAACCSCAAASDASPAQAHRIAWAMAHTRRLLPQLVWAASACMACAARDPEGSRWLYPRAPT